MSINGGVISVLVVTTEPVEREKAEVVVLSDVFVKDPKLLKVISLSELKLMSIPYRVKLHASSLKS